MAKQSGNKTGEKTLVQNRKARHDYFIEETMQAGLELVGTEVKSIRAGKANLKDCYVQVQNGEAFVVNMHISPYDAGNRFNHEPLRRRRLLLHRREIMRLAGLVQQQGYSLVPLRLYLVRGYVKMDVAVAKGKKLYDKRHDIAKRDAQRDMERHLKGSRGDS